MASLITRLIRYDHRPPPWSSAEIAVTVDRRYSGLEVQLQSPCIAACTCSPRRSFTSPQVPASESLEDCRERLLPFLTDELRPAMAEAITRHAAAAAAAEASGERDEEMTAGPFTAPTGGEVPAFVVCASEGSLRYVDCV